MPISTSMLSRALSTLTVAAVALASVPALASSSKRDTEVEDAIVKIYTVFSSADHYNPWLQNSPRSRTGSGCVIEGNRILTNAHVVSDQTFIQVRRHGDARRIPARVVAVAHEADLALLTVDDPGFFDDIHPLEVGELPAPQDDVSVYGFPQGGDSLSITQGVISRIEHLTYAHASAYLLAGQIDAAINPGNSGGPVIQDGEIVGVVMQGIPGAENIGYMVPPPVIEHVLEDIEDGRYDGFPSLGVAFQPMENPDLRLMSGMDEDQSGVLVVRVMPGGSAAGLLKAGDVLLAMDGQDIANDATVPFRPRERTSLSYLVQRHALGESIEIEGLRDGERFEIEFPLDTTSADKNLIPDEQHDQEPSYLIYGGLVFTKVTKSYLKEWGGRWQHAAPRWLVARLHANYREREGQELVVVSQVLAAEVNEGYHDVSSWVVSEIDGEKVWNMADVARLLDRETDDRFLVVSGEDEQKIVMDRGRARADGPTILATYDIPADRSDDLAPPAPLVPETAPESPEG